MKYFSKSERLIYFVILFWILLGVLGIWKGSVLAQLAGYYTSLTLFISTYLWGENKRESSSTTVFKKGKSSSREAIIYLTLILWAALGVYGILFKFDINQLTVYFASLSPFVSSYIIAKSTKKGLPVFDTKHKPKINKTIELCSDLLF